MIFILDRALNVLNIIKNHGGVDGAPPFFDDVHTQDLNTGAETFQFTTIDSNGVGSNLEIGNYVAFKGKNGKAKLFQIMSTESSHEEVIFVTVYCESAGLELINKVFRKRKINSCTLKKFIDTVTVETGWQRGSLFLTDRTLDLDLETSSVYATLQNNVRKFGGELEFRVEIENGRVTGKYIDVPFQRGRITGKRFEYSKNIESIHRKVDATELFDSLVGIGKDGITFENVTVKGIDKPLGQDFVVDQEAFKRYNNNGRNIMGLFEFDTTSPEELLLQTYKELQKKKYPKVEYEIGVALLKELTGDSESDVSIGDTVSVIDHSFNPPIALMARVTKLEESKTDQDKDTCTLANFIEVQSNITEEMRRMASKLEGYVDNTIGSKFPIGGEDIKNGAISTNHIVKDSITTELLNAEVVNAVKGKFEELEAKDADIAHLIATKAEITSVDAVKIDVEKLRAKDSELETAIIKKAEILEGNIETLKNDKAEIKDLHAVKGSIDKLNGKVAEIDVVKGNVAEIETIVNGNISSTNIQSGGITGDRLNMKTVFIEDGNILNISAAKINSGEINTSKVLLKSEDGGMKLIGSTQQFLDEKGNVRIQLGKDAHGSFDFYIMDDKGNILFNTNGITGNAIEKGLIKGDMIGKGEVGGDLINWASFTSEFNKESNTSRLKASKVVVDKTGQALDVAFNEMGSKVDGIKSETDSHTTQLNVHQGRIDAIIADTTIEKDGKKTKLKDSYNSTVVEVDSMKNTIVKQQTVIDDNTGKITATQNKANELKRDLDSTISRVTASETNINKVKDQINGINTEINSSKSRINEVKQDLNGVTIKVGETEKIVTSHSSQIVDINSKADNAITKSDQAKKDAIVYSDELGKKLKADAEKYATEVATAKTKLAKEEVMANLDGKISEEEKKRIKQAQDNLNIAIDKAEKAKADAIAHAENLDKQLKEKSEKFANEVAIAKANLAKEEAIADANNKISAEEQKRLKQAQDNLNIAIAKANEAESKAKAHAEQMKKEAVDIANVNMNNIINNLEIGAYNLARESGNFIKNVRALEKNGDAVTLEIDSDNKFRDYNVLKIKGNSGVSYHDYIELQGDTVYCYSCWLKSDNVINFTSSTPLHMWLKESKQDEACHREIIIKHSKAINSTWQQVFIVFKTPSEKQKYLMKPFVYGIGEATVWLANFQVKKGSVLSDWTPNPSDLKMYAEEIATAKAELAKTEAIANADGKISEEEQKRIAEAKANLDIAIARSEKAKVDAIAHAENLDKQLKADAQKYAEQVAIAKANLAKTEAMADNTKKIVEEEQKRIKQAQDNLNTALSKADKARQDAIDYSKALSEKLKVDAQKYADEVAIAKSNLAKTEAVAYADGKISAEEQKRITEAKANLNTAITKAEKAKSDAITHAENLGKQLKENAEKYADGVAVAKANLAKEQAIADAKSKISEEEKKRLAEAKKNLETAIAKANEAESKAKTHADTVSEQKKNDAINASKNFTKESISNIEVGGTNLLDDSERERTNHPSDRGEYLCVDITSIIKENLGKEITLSGEIKAKEKAGYISIYSLGKYQFNASTGLACVTDKYTPFSLTIKPTYNPKGDNGECSNWSFYGQYGSKVFPCVRKLKVELGNKATSWSPSRNDLNKYVNEVAIAKAELAKTEAIANADGKITAEEQKRIKQAQDNLNTAIAKANEAENKAKAHANTVAEQKKNEAVNASKANISKAIDDLEIGGENLVSNLPKNWEVGSINQSVALGSDYNQVKYQMTTRLRVKDLIEIKDIFSISYNNSLFSCCLALFDSNKKYLGVTSGFVDWLNTGIYKHGSKVEYVAVIVRFKNDANITLKDLDKVKLKIEHGNKVTGFSLSQNDLKSYSEEVAIAKAEVAKQQAITDATNKITAEEQKRIKQAQDNLNTAIAKADKARQDAISHAENLGKQLKADSQKYINDVASAKSELIKQQMIANIDGKIDAEEQKRIAEAKKNLETAIAKANEAESKAKNYTNQIAELKKNEAISSANQVAEQKKNEAINTAKGYTNNQISEVNVKVKNADADLKVLKDQIKSKVSQVEIDKSIKNIKFGGRNLALQTHPMEYSSFDGRENDCQFSTEVVLDSLSVGDPITISFKLKYENLEILPNHKDYFLRPQGSGDVTGWNSGSFPSYDITSQINFGKGKSGETRVEYNYVMTSDAKKNNRWFFNLRMDRIAKGKIRLSEFMVEYGTHRTAYTPAPEDVQKSIIDSKNEVTEKINKATSEINQTRDSINASVKSLQSETQKITTNVTNLDNNLTNKIASNLNDAKSFANQVADQKKNDAINHANSVAEQKKNEAIRDSRSVPDTRNDNQSPGWYFSNYPRQTITEFKYAQTVKIPVKDNPYGTLETKVPWGDSSGGYPVQTFRSNSTSTYQRHGVDASNWSSWEEVENTTGSQAKVNAGVNAAKQYTNAQITTVNQKVSNVESSVNILKDQIKSKVSQVDIEKNIETIRTERVIYAKGTGNDFNANSRVVVNGRVLVDGQGRGLKILALNKDNLSQVFNKDYDTYDSESDKVAFVNKINELNNGDFIIVITSQDASYPLHPPIKQALEKIGATLFDNGGGTFREAYALIGKSRLGKSNGIEMFIPRTANDKRYAEVSVKLCENGSFLGVNSGNLGDEVTKVKSSISDVSSELTQTKNSINASVNSLTSKTNSIEQNLNGKASKSEVSEVNKQVSSIKADLGGITQRVSNTESKTNQINGKLASAEARIANAEQKITPNAIINTVSSTIDSKVNGVVNKNVAEFKQNIDAFKWTIEQRSNMFNILPNGSFEGDGRTWVCTGEFWSGKYSGYGFKGRCVGAIKNPHPYNNPEQYLMSYKAFRVKKYTTYTLNFKYALEQNCHSMDVFAILSSNETGDYAKPIHLYSANGGSQTDNNNECCVSKTFNTGDYEWVWIRFDNNGMKSGVNVNEYCWLYVSEVGLYEGDVGKIKWCPAGGENYSNTFQMDGMGFKASFQNGSYTLLDKDGFEWYDAGSGHSYHALTYVTSFGIPAGNPGKTWVKLPREFTKRKNSLKWTVALRGYYYSTYGNFFPFHVHVTGGNEYEENGLIVCPIEGFCRIQNAGNPNDIQPQSVTAMLIAIA